MKGSTRYMLALVAVSMVVMVSGCQGLAQTAVEKATGVKVDKNGNSVTVQGQDGQSVTVGGEQGKLPDGFPTDVPIYQPSTVGSSMSIASDKGNTFTVELKTDAAVSDVATWYATELANQGWEIKANATGGDGGTLINCEKGDNVLTVTLAPGSGSDSQTTIALMYAPK